MGTPKGRPSWLTPYWLAWTTRFGTPPEASAGTMARVLKPKHDKYGPEMLGPAFAAYLADTEAKYVSLHKFADTCTDWAQAGKPEERWQGGWTE